MTMSQSMDSSIETVSGIATAWIVTGLAAAGGCTMTGAASGLVVGSGAAASVLDVSVGVGSAAGVGAVVAGAAPVGAVPPPAQAARTSSTVVPEAAARAIADFSTRSAGAPMAAAAASRCSLIRLLQFQEVLDQSSHVRFG